jgi:hypothetical protein
MLVELVLRLPVEALTAKKIVDKTLDIPRTLHWRFKKLQQFGADLPACDGIVQYSGFIERNSDNV